MTEPLVISTALPNCREGRLHPLGIVDPALMREIGPLAEQLGYESLWLNEFPQTEPKVAARYPDPPSYFDPLITIAAVGEQTHTIRFVTSTVVLPIHHPILLAKQIVSLDHFTGGRITLGIGLGGSAEEYRTLRADIEKANRGKMLDEYVPALRALWGERRASFEGHYAHFTDVEQYPKPLQDPLPIYMAGTAEGVYRRIAAHGQGWIDTLLQPDAIQQVAEQLRQMAAEEGRHEPIAIARQFYISLGDTDAAARRNYAEAMETDDPPPTPEPGGMEMTLVGTPDRVAARIRDYVEAGITEACAIFYAPTGRATMEQMQLFADQVAPVLRSAR